MKKLSLREQDEILKVIDYLVETQNTNVTVEQVLKRFSLTVEEYRMCCNLARPALAQANLGLRIRAFKGMCKGMRNGIKEAYLKLDEKDDGEVARVVRRLYRMYCDKTTHVAWGTAEEEEDG